MSKPSSAFLVSLFPFVTGWLGENHFSLIPTLLYGLVLLMADVAYQLLARAIISAHGGSDLLLAKAIGKDQKGIWSIKLYILAIPSLLLTIGCL